MADQHSDDGVGVDRPNVAVESFESTAATDRHSEEHVSADNVPVGSLESTSVANQHSVKDSGTTNDAVGSLESARNMNQVSDKGSGTTNVSVGNLEPTGLTNQDYGKESSIPKVYVGSLESTSLKSQDSSKNSTTTNDSVGGLMSTGSTNQDSGKDLRTTNVSAGGLKSKGVDNQDSDTDSSKANVSVGSLESTAFTNKDSSKDSSTTNVSVGSLESTSLTNQDFGKNSSTSNVSVGSLESPVVGNQDSRKDSSTSNVNARSLESKGVAEQHSDEGVSIANVAVESLKSKGVADKNSNDATKTNVTTENSGSRESGQMVEINIKTLDSKLHSFNVNKNMPVSIFKEKIASEIGFPVDQQRLIFRGKVLKDEDLLSEYHVESGHTLHLVSRQPSEFQSSSGSPNAETTARSGNTGQDANATGTRPQVGHVSHSVVLGTLGVEDQDRGGNQDVNQVIGAVLNSFGIGAQALVGGAGVGHPNIQLSIPVQVTQGNETGANLNNHGQIGASPDVPTLATPIPDSLITLSGFMNHMDRTLSQNGYQPSTSTEELPVVELPSNARGLLSPAALAVVMRHAQRLLSGPVIDSLSHITRKLEEEKGITDITVRTQIQTEAMQCGLAMQHLGALLLELGRTMLTLHIGQSPAESSVNAGPAVYISPTGPNPIMVQPFPLQTNSLFGGHATPMMNHGAFGARHLNIHIHAGSRATTAEANQREVANGNAGVNSQTRGVVDNMMSGNQPFVGQADTGLPDVRMDTRGTGNATSSSTKMKSLSETESGSSSSQRTNTPKTSLAIPLGLGPGGLQPKRRHRQTRSEAGTSGASASAGSQLDPATIMNQVMQNPALNNVLTSVSNQNGAGSQDFMKNLFSQLAQNPAMMNTVHQFAQQMDGNQDLASMLGGVGGGSGGGNLDISNIVQQMMPFVSQALNRRSSSSNLLQSIPPSRKGTLHRRYSSVKSLNISERSSDFQMNLENAAQKIVDQYPPLEIFSSLVETTAALHNNVYDTSAIDDLCMEEELAQEFIEMLKRDIFRRLQGDR